jgi:glycerophosphoryl diester phosphodiesterase
VIKYAVDGDKNAWEIEAGWGDAEKARYKAPPQPVLLGGKLEAPAQYLSGLTYSTCDVLKYKTPVAVACERLGEHPVVSADKDDGIYRGIARLDLVGANPARQHELFGWKTPSGNAPAERTSFEAIKAHYWNKVCASSLAHLDLLKDTADFKAVDLLRLLYLAGELPPHLWERSMPGRALGSIRRDENFSEKVETRITDALLEFKYWVDDPFHLVHIDQVSLFGPVGEPLYAGDLEAIITRRQEAREKKEPAADDDHDMTYWSENHQLLFASAEYLAGQWMPDQVFRAGLRFRLNAAQGTRPGDMTGEQRMRHAKPRLIRWLDDRLRFGFSEWNAPGYYAEDIRPLINLVDFCLDEEIRTRAQMVLDLAIFDLARFTLKGNFGATAGRCYFNQKSCAYEQAVFDLAEVLFGTQDGVLVYDGEETAGAFASSRGYTAPDVLIKIGQDRPRRLVDRSRVSINFEEAETYGVGFKGLEDAMFWWGRGAFFPQIVLACTRDVAIRYGLTSTPPFARLSDIERGFAVSRHFIKSRAFPPSAAARMSEGPSLTRANLYTYKNRNAMLSSAQNFHAGQMGVQVHVCQATLGVGAMVWTTHLSAGGSVKPASTIFGVGADVAGPIGGFIALGVATMTGDAEVQDIIPADWSDGPNWWTGSATLPRVVQREGAAILAYNPGGDMEDIFGAQTHAWFPKPAFGDSVVQRLSSDCNTDDGNWTFGKVDDGYVGLFSARQVDWTTEGPWTDKELMAESGRNIFIIQIGDADEFITYENFVEKVSGARVHINGLRWRGSDFECSYDIPSPNGGRLELHYDDDQVRYNGAAFSDDNFPRFETPYVKCGRVRWGQYHYTISFDNSSLTHDFRELRTKVEGASVHRYVDSAEYDCEDDRFWVISDRGARRVYPENTLEACLHAVEHEGAMALLVDACLTADGEVALWHDWSPGDFHAVLRKLGLADVGAYRPAAPDSDDPLWRETVELTLAQLRFAYGYEPVDAAAGTEPAPFSIPTLAELVKLARGWAGLRHLLINVRVPVHHAAQYAGEMLGRIIESLESSTPFDLTLVITDEEVLNAMKASAASTASPTPITFAWLSVVTDIPAKEGGAVDYTARDAAIREHSAVEGAIRNLTEVAVLSRIPTATETPFDDYERFVLYDVALIEPYNLNPRENKGHQVKQLLAAVRDNAIEMQILLEMGVSGIITDDVPTLCGVVAKADRL